MSLQKSRKGELSLWSRKYLDSPFLNKSLHMIHVYIIPICIVYYANVCRERGMYVHVHLCDFQRGYHSNKGFLPVNAFHNPSHCFHSTLHSWHILRLFMNSLKCIILDVRRQNALSHRTLPCYSRSVLVCDLFWRSLSKL